MLEGPPVSGGGAGSGIEPEDQRPDQPRVTESVGAAPQRSGLGRGLAEIIDDSAAVGLSALLGERAVPDVHDLQRAGASLVQALVPGSAARWADPGDDRTAPTGSSTCVRFHFADHTRSLLIHCDEPLSTVEVDRLHDVALLLLAAFEPAGATSYRLERAAPG